MTIIILTFMAGLLGAYCFWSCRDDDVEVLLYWKLVTDFWRVFILLSLSVLFYTYSDSVLITVLASLLMSYILLEPHNLLLSPAHTQTVDNHRGTVQKALFKLLRIVPGTKLGWPKYWAYSFFRYCLPVSLLGYTLGLPYYWALGLLSSMCYYPWTHSEFSKFYRAGILGFLLTSYFVYFTLTKYLN